MFTKVLFPIDLHKESFSLEALHGDFGFVKRKTLKAILIFDKNP
jgi:hypothetical protein